VSNRITPIEILKKWTDYSHYDPEQKKFNILSTEYVYHKCNDNIARFMEYEPTGILGIIYAKNCFEKLLEDSRIKAIDIVKNRDALKEEFEMWDIFNSADVKAAEKELLDNISNLISQIVGNKMLGERDLEAEKKALFSSVDAVVEELDKCNVDLFLRGGPIGKITKFDTHIHVFERLAECLLAIEAANDGIYLCYINSGGTSDGYFGFFIKSNGNILFINERVNEAYQGQHKNSRNGRWSEEKKYNLFPYNYIFDFEEHDYKGYASKHLIDVEQLAFFNLKPKAYMPLVLAMVLLNTKYQNADTSKMPIKYVDSLLSVNLAIPTPGIEALMVPENSAIVAVNRSLELQMDTESIMNGEYAKRFSDKNRHYSERGSFPTEPNIFVELYGEGFKIDTQHLLEANKHLKCLPESTEVTKDMTPNAEFVGTQARMEVVAYSDVRIQLAEYIRDKMLEEYLAFGGKTGVTEWYDNLLQASKDHILSLCVQKYNAVQEGTEKTVKSFEWRNVAGTPLRFIDFDMDCKGYPVSSYIRVLPFNPPHARDKWGREDGRYVCPITGNLASMFFVFRFNDWSEIAKVFGEENIPKIVKGWKSDKTGHRGYGNSILDATDAVSRVGTVFENNEIRWNRRLWDSRRWRNSLGWENRDVEPPKTLLPQDPYFSFDFAVGFSKRGFKTILKKHN